MDCDLVLSDSDSEREPEERALPPARPVEDSICRDLELFGTQLVEDVDGLDVGSSRLVTLIDDPRPANQQEMTMEFDKMSSSFERALELMAAQL